MPAAEPASDYCTFGRRQTPAYWCGPPRAASETYSHFVASPELIASGTLSWMRDRVVFCYRRAAAFQVASAGTALTEPVKSVSLTTFPS